MSEDKFQFRSDSFRKSLIEDPVVVIIKLAFDGHLRSLGDDNEDDDDDELLLWCG